MLGSDLVHYLSPKFRITGIEKANYLRFVGRTFDIVINANGNSKRFWANQNPVDDFIASTVSVYKSIFDFNPNVYIYISSSDVYENHSNISTTQETQSINPNNLSVYGFNKYLSEMIVKKYAYNYLILRSSMILGKELRKGPFYDVMNNKPLYITADSKLQLITTKELANIISFLISKRIYKEVFNVGGVGSFSFQNIQQYFNDEIKYSKNGEKQNYEMNVEKMNKLFTLKTSDEYLQEFLKTNNLLS